MHIEKFIATGILKLFLEQKIMIFAISRVINQLGWNFQTPLGGLAKHQFSQNTTLINKLTKQGK